MTDLADIKTLNRHVAADMPSTDELWETFCKLRLQSKAYRAIDDPTVRQAYEAWRRADEQDDSAPQSNVIRFPTWRVARG